LTKNANARGAHVVQPSSALLRPTGEFALSVALTLCIMPAATFFFSSLVLLTGAHLGPLIAWCILLVSVGGAVYVSFRAQMDWKAPALALALAIAAGALSHWMIDTTFDGQGYHYVATRALADGWNPIFDGLELPASVRAYGSEPVYYYAQAGWRVSAVLVAAGFDSETAKLVPMLLAGALAFGAFGCAATWGASWLQSVAFAGLTAGNPIIIVQVFTRMNDGQIASCFGLTAVFFALWLRDRRLGQLLAALGAMAYALNLKFSAIPLFVLLCVIIVGAAAVAVSRGAAFRAALTLLCSALFSIAILGAQPYVTNTIDHGHPFYPIAGDHRIDIMSGNRPAGFTDMSAGERLFRSYFSATANGFRESNSLKAPFTITGAELRDAGRPDARVAGFGPFFLGATLIALTISVWVLLTGPAPSTIIALGVAWFLMVVSMLLPEAWWARYAPQVWWFPCIVAGVGILAKRQALKVAGWVLAALVLLNSGLVAASASVYTGLRAYWAHRQLSELAAITEPIRVYLGPAVARYELLIRHGVHASLSPNPLPASCEPILLDSTYTDASYCVIADN
jgi:hypothetical protein